MIGVPVARWDGGLLCAGVGYVDEHTIHGSPDDPRVVWMTGPNGERTELAWPPGYAAKFTPGLELLDQDGTVVAREGTQATGGCQTSERGVYSVSLPKVP